MICPGQPRFRRGRAGGVSARLSPAPSKTTYRSRGPGSGSSAPAVRQRNRRAGRCTSGTGRCAWLRRNKPGSCRTR